MRTSIYYLMKWSGPTALRADTEERASDDGAQFELFMRTAQGIEPLLGILQSEGTPKPGTTLAIAPRQGVSGIERRA